MSRHDELSLRDSSSDLGLRLMMKAAPLAGTIVGIPRAVASFVAGWSLQVAFHAASRREGEPDSVGSGLDEATADLLG